MTEETKPKTPPSHAADFAVHQIGKQPQTTGMLFVAFTQVGNVLPGVGTEGQKQALRDLLSADPRLAYDAETDTWTDKAEAAEAAGEGQQAV